MLLVVLTSLLAACIAVAISLLRLQHILNRTRRKPLRHGRRNPNEPTHLLIVLGSGGHTAEMLAMLERAVMGDRVSSATDTARDTCGRLSWRDYTYRTWVVSAGDHISASRAKDFEERVLAVQSSASGGRTHDQQNSRSKGEGSMGSYNIVVVPRARAIHQPLWTAPGSSWACLRACWTVLTAHTTATRDGHLGMRGERDFPDVILCNGPATATILVLTSVVLRYFNVHGCNTRSKMRTIYVESWARVKRLSLSGRLLLWIVDRFIVQWPQLASSVGPRAEYLGVLV